MYSPGANPAAKRKRDGGLGGANVTKNFDKRGVGWYPKSFARRMFGLDRPMRPFVWFSRRYAERGICMTQDGQRISALLVGDGDSPVARSITGALAERNACVHEVGNVYEAVVLLARQSGEFGIAFVDVDSLTGDQMRVFAFLRRRWAKLPVVAYGKRTSGNRLAAAAAAGAASIIAGPLVNGQLNDLLPTASKRPTAAPVSAPPRRNEIITEAEMSALLGSDCEAPAAKPQKTDSPPKKPRSAAATKRSNVKRTRKKVSRKKP